MKALQAASQVCHFGNLMNSIVRKFKRYTFCFK
ncbi:hypothetical protein CGLO_13330 [Colletotrichum gloeosporioides Cg-14]|uniref:Uncharacterized protein n=1 Tax=Colletotrichum gloeosporioides (strain Cg-14) TaxID=1237896 RepID=T0LH58_COLGC|nr:hypothetical protein CGLO_13330 [Colletotrichum gloeosporioides Cg-14]